MKVNEVVSQYDMNVAILKHYGGRRYKLVNIRCLRKKGFESKKLQVSQRGTVNTEKLSNSISRARSKIFEYCMCNYFEWFVTLTLDKTKYNRSDLRKFIKDLGQFIRDYRKKHNADIKYLFIPELHLDGQNWHMHGFIDGIPEQDIKKFDMTDNVPLKLIDKGYSNWTSYASKFGFVSMDKIRNKEACSKYITKYVSEDLSARARELNSKLYYNSKGLKTAVEIKKGTMSGNIIPDFKNDYVAIKWFNNLNEAEKYIC